MTPHCSGFRFEIVHLYVGHSEEKYKEANESFQLGLLCSQLSSFPSVYNGVDWRLDGKVHRVKLRVVWVFVQHIVYITLNHTWITLS